MDKEPLIRMIWQGNETLSSIIKHLDRTDRIEITLPANVNHTLFRILNPDAPVSALENIDYRAGPELLADIAHVPGLEDLTELTEALTNANATLHVLSPPTLVIDLTSSTQETHA